MDTTFWLWPCLSKLKWHSTVFQKFCRFEYILFVMSITGGCHAWGSVWQPPRGRIRAESHRGASYIVRIAARFRNCGEREKSISPVTLLRVVPRPLIPSSLATTVCIASSQMTIPPIGHGRVLPNCTSQTHIKPYIGRLQQSTTKHKLECTCEFPLSYVIFSADNCRTCLNSTNFVFTLIYMTYFPEALVHCLESKPFR